MEMLSNLHDLFVGEAPNLLYFLHAFSAAASVGIMPPLAFALFGDKIPGMNKECFASLRLLFGGYAVAIVAVPLKTGYTLYDAILLVMASFVACYLLFLTKKNRGA
jgi:hypothetical protein